MKRAVLLDALKRFSAQIFSRHPIIAVALSGFANGVTSPDEWGKFWKEVAKAALLKRVYIQSGVGVHKLTSEQAATYIAAVKRELAAINVDVVAVAEAFTQLSSGSEAVFRARPVSLESLLQQIHAILAVGGREVALFSVPDYMTFIGGEEAEVLGKAWEQALPQAQMP